MPVLTQAFLDIYGWRGALLLLSGISMHYIPCGALINQRHGHDEQDEHKAPLLPSIADNNSDTYLTKETSSSGCFKLDSLKESHDACCSTLLTNLPFIAQVFIPGFVWGYTLTGWLIYIVSFAVSNKVSLRDASIVSTCGGIGQVTIRALLPVLNKLMTYRHLMYISSVLSAISLTITVFFNTFTGMCLMSLLFGAGVGILGSEVYIVIKEVTKKSEYLSAVAFLNWIHGIAAIASGFLTGMDKSYIFCCILNSYKFELLHRHFDFHHNTKVLYSPASTVYLCIFSLALMPKDVQNDSFAIMVQDPIGTLWSWTINNLEKYSKLNMLQDHI